MSETQGNISPTTRCDCHPFVKPVTVCHGVIVVVLADWQPGAQEELNGKVPVATLNWGKNKDAPLVKHLSKVTVTFRDPQVQQRRWAKDGVVNVYRGWGGGTKPSSIPLCASGVKGHAVMMNCTDTTCMASLAITVPGPAERGGGPVVAHPTRDVDPMPNHPQPSCNDWVRKHHDAEWYG